MREAASRDFAAYRGAAASQHDTSPQFRTTAVLRELGSARRAARSRLATALPTSTATWASITSTVASITTALGGWGTEITAMVVWDTGTSMAMAMADAMAVLAIPMAWAMDSATTRMDMVMGSRS